MKNNSRSPRTHSTPLGRVKHVPKPGLAPATPDEKRRNRRASVLAGAVVTGLLIAVNQLPSDQEGTATTKIGERIAAIKKNDKFLNTVVVLTQGAKIRLTPERLDGTTPKNGLPNNVGYVVPEGKEVVITRPAQDSDTPNWISFMLPGKRQGLSIKETAAATGYANLTLLADAGKAEQISLATNEDPAQEHPTKLGENGKYIYAYPLTGDVYNYGHTSEGDVIAYKDNRESQIVGSGGIGLSAELDAGTYNNMK